MIAAHSAFLSMSASEALCTLRILPRIGSRAWNSESRASFAVPSAELPSTMNSSVRSRSSLRQSTSFAGIEEDSSAFLRRCTSRWVRAATRARMALATFSATALTTSLSPRGGLVSQAVSSLLTTAATIRDAAGVPRISLVWPSNCGSARRTVITAVAPSRASSLVIAPSLGAQHLGGGGVVVERLDQRPLEAGDVGAALGRGHDVDERAHLRVVVVAPPQRDVDHELALDLGAAPCGRACPGPAPSR